MPATTSLPDAVVHADSRTFAPRRATANHLWTDLPMSAGIATLVCYAGVFGDVIGVEEMAERLGAAGTDEFYLSLAELHRQRRLVLRDGYAALPGLEEKIDAKPAKIETTRQLIAARRPDIERLARNPFLSFVGISGSLAANNPVKDRRNHLDIDIFLITRRQCLWLYIIPRNLRNLFPRREVEPKLCLNYVMDASGMRVTNRNFYTATEIRNLIPVAGAEGYRRFLQANRWVDYYYPGFSGATGPDAPPAARQWINRSLYVVFSVLKSIKTLSLEPLRTLSFDSGTLSVTNFDRVGQNHGGYQELVHRKFSRLAATWFSELVDAALIRKLFPDVTSPALRTEPAGAPSKSVAQDLGYDYSKYA